MREITEDIKVGDKVVTRDGREGRVICTDRDSGFPIVCLIVCKNKQGELYEDVTYHSKDGRCGCRQDFYETSIFLPPKTISLDLYEVNKNGRVHHIAITKGDTPVSMGDITYIKTIEEEIE